MRRFRRPLLWLPLVVLMLPLLALGWRNWHLSMDEDDVLVAIPIYYRPPENTSVNALNIFLSNAPLPFADGETTWISTTKNGRISAPSSKLMAHLKTLYPKARLIPDPKPQKRAACSISFGEIEFINRFQAQCSVRYIRRRTRQRGREEAEELLSFGRSPFNFKDPNWHVKRLLFTGTRSSVE